MAEKKWELIFSVFIHHYLRKTCNSRSEPPCHQSSSLICLFHLLPSFDWPQNKKFYITIYIIVAVEAITKVYWELINMMDQRVGQAQLRQEV